jgi:hypothetical protein
VTSIGTATVSVIPEIDSEAYDRLLASLGTTTVVHETFEYDDESNVVSRTVTTTVSRTAAA